MDRKGAESGDKVVKLCIQCGCNLFKERGASVVERAPSSNDTVKLYSMCSMCSEDKPEQLVDQMD